ncbi:hypothetical protein DAI22_08g197600 [Oryza sativa Japonica Group]|nr:hypothetical protein DAI22_08g197600 [Oryza sativa Japonica Group]
MNLSAERIISRKSARPSFGNMTIWPSLGHQDDVSKMVTFSIIKLRELSSFLIGGQKMLVLSLIFNWRITDAIFSKMKPGLLIRLMKVQSDVCCIHFMP